MPGKLSKISVIVSDMQAARDLEEALLRDLGQFGYSEASIFAIKLALEEALNNAIRHGNCCDKAKHVTVSIELDERQMTVTIADEGPGFNPCCVPDPTADENIEKPSGRGIMLMRAFMDEVCYNDCGNQIRLVKRNT